MYKLFNVCLTIGLFCVLSACGKEDVTKQINNHLESTVEIEKEFEETQEKIYELEKNDEELYKKIIELGSDEFEQVQSLTTEAIDLLDERYEYVKEEKKSIDHSKEEFEKIKPLIEDISDENQKKQTEKMFKTMMERYKAYEDVYYNYSDSIQLTKQLYELLQEEKLNEEIYSLIENVNESYDSVLKANESFNKHTLLYNNLKNEYYDMYQQ